MRPTIIDVTGTKGNKNKLTAVLFFGVGIVLLALTVGASRQSQDIRERAQTSGQNTLTLELVYTNGQRLTNTNALVTDEQGNQLPITDGIAVLPQATVAHTYSLDLTSIPVGATVYETAHQKGSGRYCNYAPPGSGSPLSCEYPPSLNEIRLNAGVTSPTIIGWTLTGLAAPSIPASTPVLGRFCQELSDVIATATGANCGDPAYNKIADLNKDGQVRTTDFSILRLNVADEGACNAFLIDSTDPCTHIGSTALTFELVDVNGQRLTDARTNTVVTDKQTNTTYQINNGISTVPPVTAGHTYNLTTPNGYTLRETSHQKGSGRNCRYTIGITPDLPCTYVLSLNEIQLNAGITRPVIMSWTLAGNEVPSTPIPTVPTNIPPTPTTPVSLPAPQTRRTNCDSDPSTHMICGYVFVDANNDGIRQTTEAGVAQVSVTATAGIPVTAHSIASGWFNTAGLTLGTYTVTMQTPTGYTGTTRNTGSINLTVADPDNNPATDDSDGLVNFGVTSAVNQCVANTSRCSGTRIEQCAYYDIFNPSLGTRWVPFVDCGANAGANRFCEVNGTVASCVVSVSPTVTTTVSPTTPPNPNCACTNNSCSADCASSGTNGFACRQTNHCQRNARVRGDTNGDGVINGVDLDWYRRWVLGEHATIPTQYPNVNPDIDGDNRVDPGTDRQIILDHQAAF